MAIKKSTTKKLKKVSISLTEREADLLQYYAKAIGTTKGTALKKLMKAGLKEYVDMVAKSVPSNQLGLFDAMQTDIFSVEDGDKPTNN